MIQGALTVRAISSLEQIKQPLWSILPGNTFREVFESGQADRQEDFYAIRSFMDIL